MSISVIAKSVLLGFGLSQSMDAFLIVYYQKRPGITFLRADKSPLDSTNELFPVHAVLFLVL